MMFAFEWCEFCWSVRKLFARCRIPYRERRSRLGRAARGGTRNKDSCGDQARTGALTIPQVFVGGHWVGDSKTVFDAFQDGRLQTTLSKHGVVFDESVRFDPSTLLPNWLQRRL